MCYPRNFTGKNDFKGTSTDVYQFQFEKFQLRGSVCLYYKKSLIILVILHDRTKNTIDLMIETSKSTIIHYPLLVFFI